VHPYRLALAGGGLYLIACVPAYDEFRTFATERIERLSIGDETFRRTRELPARLFSQSMGVFSGEPERIDLEFTPTVAPFVRGRVWHESQQIEELADGRLRMRLDVSNDWALRSWLLGFGAAVRVVSPPALALEIGDELTRASAQYR
jgi:predicted DNA-binding transcriptional regulator YafY